MVDIELPELHGVGCERNKATDSAKKEGETAGASADAADAMAGPAAVAVAGTGAAANEGAIAPCTLAAAGTVGV